MDRFLYDNGLRHERVNLSNNLRNDVSFRQDRALNKSK